jgi:hypothetical protein
MSPKLIAIRDALQEAVFNLIETNAPDIEREMDRSVIAAAKVKKPAFLDLAFAVKASLEHKPTKIKIRFGKAHSDEIEETLKDPNQPDLIPEAGE